MKKMLPLALVAVVATMLFTSCKKDYTCTCTYIYPGDPNQVTTVTINDTKGKAKDRCNTVQAVGQTIITDPGESYTCHL